MAFSEDQAKKLGAKLSPKNVKCRQNDGVMLHYIEGWHAISEANRIFGYDAWDRATLSAKCVWSGMHRNSHACAYTARVRITVRAGDLIVTREGSGAGEGRGLTPGEAHDIALKTAETDATKRALATFGNPFGLALYDKELKGVRTAQKIAEGANEREPRTSWALRSRTGTVSRTFETPTGFSEGLRDAITGASDIEALFGIWEQNVDTVRVLSRLCKRGPSPKDVIGKSLVSHFKARAIAISKGGGSSGPKNNGRSPRKASERSRIDKSKLPLSEPKRKRSREHLRHVAEQPCLVCGRKPAQAHHLRFAQPSAMARKVSDEFTVPLCAIHHHEVHHAGDEKAWWMEKSLEPLSIARRLWEQGSVVS